MTKSPARTNAKSSLLILPLGAILALGGVVLAAPGGVPKSASSTIDDEFRAAYPLSEPSSAIQVAGIDLARLVIPGLQITARKENAPEAGGVLLSFSDSQGAVRVLMRLAVLPDAVAARRVLDAKLHGVSTQLQKASDATLGDSAWADDFGKGTALVMATQANIAYSVSVLDEASGVPTAAALAGLIRTSMVIGVPTFPAATITLPAAIDAKNGGEVLISVSGGYPYKIRAEGGYIARGNHGPIVRPFSAGPVIIHATVVDPLARVTVVSKTILAK